MQTEFSDDFFCLRLRVKICLGYLNSFFASALHQTKNIIFCMSSVLIVTEFICSSFPCSYYMNFWLL